MVRDLIGTGTDRDGTTTTSNPAQGSQSSDGRHSKDLNTVTGEQLEQICKIDGERAEYFLQARRELGGFKSWEEIKDKVRSFDAAMIKGLKNAGYGVGKAA